MATDWFGRLSAVGATASTSTGLSAGGPGPAGTPAIERRTCTAPDGVPLVYSAAGSGEPALIFVHGGLANRRFWDGQLQTFAARHRVIAPDLPGHGESGADRDAWSIPQFGADVRAVIEAERVAKAVLFGNSLGGPVAIETALLTPDRILGVVGVDTFHSLSYAATPDEMRRRAEAFRTDCAASVKQMVHALFHADAGPALRAEVERVMVATPPEVAYKMFLGMAGYDPSVSAGRLTMPLRAINGDLWPTDVAANLRITPGFDVHVIAHAGHFLMLERPSEFDDCVAAVVREVSTPTR
jgi:pimeloyl-ACP methyl ester carboxylesterase